MALPTTPEQWAQAAQMLREYPGKLRRLEIDLLSQWVSEVPPVVVWDNLHMIIIGVTAQGFPIKRGFFEVPDVILRA